MYLRDIARLGGLIYFAQWCLICIHGSTEWNLLHVIFLAPRILRVLLGFWKIYTPLVLDTDATK